MSQIFNPKRLILARQRRRLTGKGLAEACGLTAITISRLENGENQPDETSVSKIASALAYPVAFFYADDPDDLDSTAVSFRSLSKMSAKERDAAIAAGRLGLDINSWLEKEFTLPEQDLIDLSSETSPKAAARMLRSHWSLGERPIQNMLGLLEVKGVRVFSLAEATKHVDAFSFWRDDRPFVFLNNFKTPEHSIFDAAHELGHLVLHRHGCDNSTRSAEREANEFASEFLMPEADILSRVPRFVTVDVILKMKMRWRVSGMALAYRLHHLSVISDWQYKSACIELGRRGYRTAEPVGVERETSTLWFKVLAQLWSEKITKHRIAEKLGIPIDELENMLWGLTNSHPHPEKANMKPALRVV